MFKCKLLATTALVIVGSLSFLAVQSTAVAQPLAAATERDRNREFLCTYGDITVSHNRFAGDSGGYSYVSWTHAAAPVRGRGQTVSQIIVMDSFDGSASRATHEFSAGIYSSTLHGKPGKLIAGSVGVAPEACGKVTFTIPPTTLAKGKTYWIEEAADQLHGLKKILWAVDPKAKQNAWVQHHFSSSNYQSSGFHSSTTPWEKQSAGPWFRLH